MVEISEFVFNLVFSVLGIVIPVFATVYTVNKRIKAQTKENHQPYLVLKNIDSLVEADEYQFHYSLLKGKYENIDRGKLLNLKSRFILKMAFKNIGYGVSSNIKFYDLNTEKQIEGNQKSARFLNQKLYTTLDIASNEQEDLFFYVYSQLFERGNKDKSENFELLCIYKDLNNNINSFIITISWKDKSHFDYHAYQPTSLSYKKIYEEKKKNIKSIYQKYSE